MPARKRAVADTVGKSDTKKQKLSKETPKAKNPKRPNKQTKKTVKSSKSKGAQSKSDSTSSGKTSPKKSYTKNITEESIEASESTEELNFTEPIPKRNAKGQLVFPDWPDFRPNMTPKEVLQAGSFGGTYFRPIYSSITKQKYSSVWKELPKDWLDGLNVGKQVSSSTYHEDVNTHGVKCGGSLQMWEESGWIHPQDPYGWFMWFCRFYQGRRTEDDERQIGRWLRCAGVKGRWRNNLITKCINSGCGFDNPGVSPVVRQTLQHWAYKLNKEDHDAYAKKKKNK